MTPTKSSKKPRYREINREIDRNDRYMKRLLSNHATAWRDRFIDRPAENAPARNIFRLTASDVPGTRGREPPDLGDVPGGRCRICGCGYDISRLRMHVSRARHGLTKMNARAKNGEGRENLGDGSGEQERAGGERDDVRERERDR